MSLENTCTVDDQSPRANSKFGSLCFTKDSEITLDIERRISAYIFSKMTVKARLFPDSWQMNFSILSSANNSWAIISAF